VKFPNHNYFLQTQLANICQVMTFFSIQSVISQHLNMFAARFTKQLKMPTLW